MPPTEIPKGEKLFEKFLDNPTGFNDDQIAIPATPPPTESESNMSTTLDTVQAALAAMEDLDAELQEALEEGQTKIDEIQYQIDTVEELKGQADTLGKQVTQLLDQAADYAASMEEAVEELDTAVSDLADLNNG